jgi:hypothetical protein
VERVSFLGFEERGDLGVVERFWWEVYGADSNEFVSKAEDSGEG